jgi:2-polyprenyl-3-methyl-5-hydroxy-6-metoxy-1,4-benzoquinol methylase
MKKEYDKVFLNQYGYYELKQKPTVEERKKEFEEIYYQQIGGPYQKEYTQDELEFKNIKLEQRKYIYEKNFGREITGLSLLDIGCGEGFTLRYFKELNMHVTGIDFSSWAIEHQNKEMMQYFIQGDAEKILPLLIEKNNKYDVINMDQVLDMMVNPEKVLIMCKSLLGENGILVIKVANNYSQLQTTLLENGQLKEEYWLDDPGHPRYFNKEGLIRYLSNMGYDCIDFYGESFIDFNLINPRTNYYENPECGKDDYKARIQLETMLHNISVKKSLEVYKLLADMGFGREIIGVFKLRRG